LADGTTVAYTAGSSTEYPEELVRGGDGNLWFTVRDTALTTARNEGSIITKIGKITADGTVTLYTLPTPYAIAPGTSGMVADGNGNVWFMEASLNELGRVDSQGNVSEIALPSDIGQPHGLALTSDGTIWFGGAMKLGGQGHDVLESIAIADLSSGTPVTVTTTQGNPNPVTVLYVSPPPSSPPPSDGANGGDVNPGAAGFSAKVDWGNGNVTPASLVPGAGNTFGVQAQPAYNLSGTYPVTVVVTDPSGVQTSFHTTATVAPGPNQLYTTQLYSTLLGRTPDQAGLAYWNKQLDQGVAPQAIVADIMASPEYRKDMVDKLYQALLNRAADAGGEAYWISFLGQGHSQQDLEIAMLASPESLHPVSGGASPSWSLDSIYQSLLGQTGDAGGEQWWSHLLNTGTSPQQVVAAIAASSEAAQAFVDNAYQALLNRPADNGGLAYWSQYISDGHSIENLMFALASSHEFLNAASGGSTPTTK
jgi:hypothetical protein